MAFTVPTTLPALSPYVVPPNTVRGDAVDSVLQRDRYLFATRRRLIFTGGAFNATLSSFVTPFFFSARNEVEVEVSEVTSGSLITLTLSAGGFETQAQLLPSITAATTLLFTVSVRATGAGNLYGVYIIEEILAAGDLP